MKQERFDLQGIPGVCYGEARPRVYLYVHGQEGHKEEAAAFAERACPAGWQVLAIDLPGHGERQGRQEPLVPWTAVPELCRLYEYAVSRWERVALRATSIGAYFSLLAVPEDIRALLVSPVVDMERLILDMMGWAGVDEEMLRQEGEIATTFGQTLSWRYLTYAREHQIGRRSGPVRILYAGGDHLTARPTIEQFSRRMAAELTVMENGEHWFHTPEQLAVLADWEQKNL